MSWTETVKYYKKIYYICYKNYTENEKNLVYLLNYNISADFNPCILICSVPYKFIQQWPYIVKDASHFCAPPVYFVCIC